MQVRCPRRILSVLKGSVHRCNELPSQRSGRRPGPLHSLGRTSRFQKEVQPMTTSEQFLILGLEIESVGSPVYLPRIFPNLSLHSSDNSCVRQSIWNATGWGNDVNDYYYRVELTAGSRLIARVNTHLWLLDCWTFTAGAILPVTSTRDMHPILVHQCRAPGVGIPIDGGAGIVFYSHEAEGEDTIATGTARPASRTSARCSWRRC